MSDFPDHNAGTATGASDTKKAKGATKQIRIALVGNPNSGKSSLFNALTGLNQKIANFPGVTVEKKSGFTTLIDSQGQHIKAEIIDLPGTYSLYPKSLDEQVPFRVLCDPDYMAAPDLVVVIADSTNLKRNLFLCSQIMDLKTPVVLALNMMDLIEVKGIKIDIERLAARLGIPIVPINARKGTGIAGLKSAMADFKFVDRPDFIDVRAFSPALIDGIRAMIDCHSDYAAFQAANNLHLIHYFQKRPEKAHQIETLVSTLDFDPFKAQASESLQRYEVITTIIKECQVGDSSKRTFSDRLDKILTHRIYGYAIFLSILFIVFQAIFSWATYPMYFIEGMFVDLSNATSALLPQGILNDLIVNGILAGLGGIVIFVPQIALLFFFIGILEDTGYMARVSFIMDKLMRKVGLNGKSVIPLIGGVACAVPSIMATRSIHGWKDRMITIMVIPLMSCSARLPVYALIISLVIPSTAILGIINLQGLVLMAMYLLGFVAALMAAWVMKKLIKGRERGYYIMEMPVYHAPRWSNIAIDIFDKVKVFLFDAGKVIIAISIILWALSSYGPTERMDAIDLKYNKLATSAAINSDSLQVARQADLLENSYAGIMGHWMEPAIRPLGYDWKIGIALLTSFAAREVFVGTMSTIYSANAESEDTQSVRAKLSAEINPQTGQKRYTAAVGISLMLFYAFAMQCMSTVAVVKRETRSWKWPLIQIAYLSVLAYISAFAAYNLLS